jgi:hypothetical protein
MKAWGRILPGVIVLTLVCATTARANTPRYASVAGSGDQCTADAPCSLEAAINGVDTNHVQSGDEVIVLPGTYGSSTDPKPPLTDMGATGSIPLHIHGQAGGARPVIFSDTTGSSITLNDPGSTLSHLEFDNVSTHNGTAINLTAGDAADVVGVAFAQGSVGCELLDGALTDAICADGGAAGAAIEADTSSAPSGSYTASIHAVTAWATGDSSTGLRVHAISGTPNTVGASNSIFHGTTDVDASGSSTANLDHSSFATKSAGGGATINSGAGNVGAAQLIDPSRENFREQATSPTVDAGTSGSTPTDIYGTLRTLGTATDIGAAELVEAPQVTATGATSVTSTSATLTGIVNAEGLATDAFFLYGTTPGTGDHTASFAAGLAATQLPVGVHLTGLRPGQTYYVRLQAANLGGSIVSPLASFKTLPTFLGLTIRTTKVRVSKTHKVTIAYTCPASTQTQCTGTLKLTLKGHSAGKAAKFKVKSGKRSHATIKVSANVLAQLRKHTKVTLRATAKAKDAGGRSRTTGRSISVLAPARPKH